MTKSDAKSMTSEEDSRNKGHTKPDYPGTQKKKRRRRGVCCCSRLTIITVLVTMEAVALTFLCLRSHTIRIVDPFVLGDVNDPYDFFVWLDTTLGGGSEEEREELAELEAQLIQMTEDRLDHGLPMEHELETTALDNYYNRSSSASPGKKNMNILVVGGLTGSGTKAVVDALSHLHVPMITLDHPATGRPSKEYMQQFHIGQIAWRNMIQIVLNRGTTTSNYQWKDLPLLAQMKMKQEWEKLYQGYVAKQLPESRYHDSQLPVLFGFEAHDSLFMLPVLQELIPGNIQYIHVVRDGRDVSLLSRHPETAAPGDFKRKPTHSMAERFVLETHYEKAMKNIDHSLESDGEGGGTPNHKQVLETMQLWNDWNQASLTWLQQKAPSNHLTLRVEDLLSPEKKLEALIELSHFVSSDLPMEAMCCLSRQSLVVESSDQLKLYATARAQRDALKEYSAKLSFFRYQEQEDENRREADRNEELSTLSSGRGRFSRASQVSEGQKEIQQHHKNRFLDIGGRLAERFTRKETEAPSNRLLRRRLLEKPPPEVAELFEEYRTWRISLARARSDEALVTKAVELGEELLVKYREHADHLKGMLTEDSFTRSIKWLKGLHGTQARLTTEEDVKRESVTIVDEPKESNETIKEASESQLLSQQERYGKWVQPLQELPVLSKQVSTIGKEMLLTFGYEPAMRFMDFDPENKRTQCQADITCS